ncbi:type II toxin-antitoxin system RelE/ParE family toxin [Azospirillum sp. RWY-5-1]|uniref:Type II toxin-antitoxin system RelE/ParE family toxin n=2 Tax=Azospirillum oleiclasticum TaxID=2735135 RepID=A0ABX2T9U6_9PROT|nr:type II toxin-antitoxin system RelE/ParE family toxin [Azospirillum oleiclasticum]NYZ13429.1 type II toxin-antitoxin system RelE/ParE family toxin [Azospirillum oleiclasticum]NYZ20590.1 type II toxin-antitoxin system RelE/ParE family toxin [Azospirillum oleiclasticum]
MTWTVETLDHRVDDELRALSPDLRARFVRIAQLLEEYGPFAVREPHVKPLGDKLWEMRMKGKDGIARAVYVTAVERRLVVLHVFAKKTQKTPASALATARRRGKEAGLLWRGFPTCTGIGLAMPSIGTPTTRSSPNFPSPAN